MKLVDPGFGAGKTMLELLDAPAEAIGWSAPVNTETWSNRIDTPVDLKKTVQVEDIPSNLTRKFYHN
jgi:dihydroxyacetone kinase